MSVVVGMMHVVCVQRAISDRFIRQLAIYHCTVKWPQMVCQICAPDLFCLCLWCSVQHAHSTFVRMDIQRCYVIAVSLSTALNELRTFYQRLQFITFSPNQLENNKMWHVVDIVLIPNESRKMHLQTDWLIAGIGGNSHLAIDAERWQLATTQNENAKTNE